MQDERPHDFGFSPGVRRIAGCFVLVVAGLAGLARADNRLLIDATIDRKPVRLIFDTGASGSSILLFSETVERLGLEQLPAPKDYRINGGDLLGLTRKYPFSCFGNDLVTDFAVYHKPPSLPQDGDGIMPYWALANNFLVFDLADKIFDVSPTPPPGLETFVHARVVNDRTKILALEIPDAQRAPVVMGIDTGQDCGVTLPHAQWDAWIAAHPGLPTTLNAAYMPSMGVAVRPEVWATEFRIGDLVLHNVPVKESSLGEDRNSPATSCVIGLYALTRLRLVLDGSHLAAYVTPSTARPPPYGHNRLGAVFVPRSDQSDDLVASVAPGSPAAAAGIVEGDVLLKVDALDVTAWKTTPGILPLGRFWEMPAGTEHVLTLRRGGQTITVKVVLNHILRHRS